MLVAAVRKIGHHSMSSGTSVSIDLYCWLTVRYMRNFALHVNSRPAKMKAFQAAEHACLDASVDKYRGYLTGQLETPVRSSTGQLISQRRWSIHMRWSTTMTPSWPYRNSELYLYFVIMLSWQNKRLTYCIQFTWSTKVTYQAYLVEQ